MSKPSQIAMVGVSVILPTYEGDDSNALRNALESIVSQTRDPDELIIICDGYIPERNMSILDEYEKEYSYVTVVSFEENKGRAIARRVGVERSRETFVAMMDADDLSRPLRLERQVRFLEKNPDVDVVGTQLLEFDPETEKQIGVRSLPTDHEEIKRLAKIRSPVSQSTVMFRRDAVIAAGNYRDVDRMEDYDLWVRMLVNGAQFANIPEILVKARAGDRMYQRRAGWEYAREEVRLQHEFVRLGFVSPPRALLNLLVRTPMRFVPNGVRAVLYNKLFRTDVSEFDDIDAAAESDMNT